jgi:hypothetical protein
MDDERLPVLYFLLRELSPRRRKRQQHHDAAILLVLLWAALWNKPMCWACDPRNKPRSWRGSMPSLSCVSRRLRDPVTLALLDLALLRLRQRLLVAAALVGCWVVDAKGFAINRHSKVKDATVGYCCVGKARGYKLFLLINAAGIPVAWHTDTMKTGEPTVARELLKKIEGCGYLLGDSIYDSNELHEQAAAKNIQLVAPRKNPKQNIDKRCASPPRLHAIAMLETPLPKTFGAKLYDRRTAIERVLSRLASSAVGLDHLPGWVRTLPRVRRWIDAKMLIALAFVFKELSGF